MTERRAYACYRKLAVPCRAPVSRFWRKQMMMVATILVVTVSGIMLYWQIAAATVRDREAVIVTGSINIVIVLSVVFESSPFCLDYDKVSVWWIESIFLGCSVLLTGHALISGLKVYVKRKFARK
jgi:hypothetical protein